MNAKELIMDYYVRLNKDIFPLKKGEILKVTGSVVRAFLPASAWCKDIKGNIYFIFEDDIDPIPLTVDILKAYGFEKTSSVVPRYILSDNLFTVFAKNINDSAWLIDVLDNKFNLPDQSAIVYHVHQLQLWLRFCGIEREIKMSSLTSINTIKTYNHESK